MEILEWEVLQNLFIEPLWSFERLWILARTHASPLVLVLSLISKIAVIRELRTK